MCIYSKKKNVTIIRAGNSRKNKQKKDIILKLNGSVLTKYFEKINNVTDKTATDINDSRQ